MTDLELDQVLRSSWPTRSRNLLLKAALLPVPGAAVAWQRWTSEFDIDRVAWADARLLAAVARRIAEISPDDPHSARLVGIRRFIWTQSQLCLTQVAPLMRSFAQAALPMLVIKGGARHARDPRSAADRLLRDVDILVPIDRASDAFDCAIAGGWEFSGPQVPARRTAPVSSHHAWSLTKVSGEVDIHHFSNFLNRNIGDDDAMWRRAIATRLCAIPILIPSPTDDLLLNVVHGVRYTPEGNADWVIDAIDTIRAGQIEWPLVLEEARMRKLMVPLLAGLTYLRQELGADIPRTLLRQLAADVVEPFLTEYQSYIAGFVPSGPVQIRAFFKAACIRAQCRAAIEAARAPNRLPIGKPPTSVLVKGTKAFSSKTQTADWEVVLPAPSPGDLKFRCEIAIETSGATNAGVELLGGAYGLSFVHWRGNATRPRHARRSAVRLTIEIPSDLIRLRSVSRLWFRVGAAPNAAIESISTRVASVET